MEVKHRTQNYQMSRETRNTRRTQHEGQHNKGQRKTETTHTVMREHATGGRKAETNY